MPDEAKSGSLPSEAEIKQYVDALSTASSRVRYLLIATTVAVITVFTGVRNSRPTGWIVQRLNLARAAVEYRIWDYSPQKPIPTDNTPRSIEIRKAIDWAKARNLHTKEDVQHQVEYIERQQIELVNIVHIPVLAVAFDVNDLGMFSGFGFSILAFLLVLSMSRQHETLVLCLWRVRRMHDAEQRPNDGQSRSNLFYHALAMTQVFTRFPTLARPRTGFAGHFAKLLFLLPLAFQILATWHDMTTIDRGLSLNRSATLQSLAVQFVALCILTCTTFVNLYLSLGGDRRWLHAFTHLDPEAARGKTQNWFKWVWGRGPGDVNLRGRERVASPLEGVSAPVVSDRKEDAGAGVPGGEPVSAGEQEGRAVEADADGQKATE